MLEPSADFQAMSTVKVDEAKRIRLPVRSPGDCYGADYPKKSFCVGSVSHSKRFR